MRKDKFLFTLPWSEGHIFPDDDKHCQTLHSCGNPAALPDQAHRYVCFLVITFLTCKGKQNAVHAFGHVLQRMRNGSDGYLNFLDDVLEIKRKYYTFNPSDYEIVVYDDLNKMFDDIKMKNTTDKDCEKHVKNRFYELSAQANSLNQTAKELQESDAIKTYRVMILDNLKYEWTPDSTYANWNELMRRTYDLYRESIDAFIQTKMKNQLKSLRARINRERRESNKNENA